jgi:DNA-3-methyladenine glycosylase II
VYAARPLHMSFFIHGQADLELATAHLLETDARLAAILAIAGPPPLRRREGGFAGLASIVVSQQLSTASAAAIWGRLTAMLDPFDAAAFLRIRSPRLQRAGLSAAKIRTLKAIASALASGALDLAALGDRPADEAHAALTALHGIGPWTADIYLLFCLGHADAWPAGDLALQEAARLAFALKSRPDAREMLRLAEAWRPWRGVAARVLWSYYRAVKGRSGVPVPARIPASSSPRLSRRSTDAGSKPAAVDGRDKPGQDGRRRRATRVALRSRSRNPKI